MQSINITVNGEKIQALTEPRTHLGDFLREGRRLTGTHLGCEHGVCGACTVLIDGVPSRSCIAFAVGCDGAEVRTIEGFDDDPVMNELRAAFNRYHGLQCGFCTPGMLIAARDLVLRLPHADEKKIRVEMSGNLCRCTGYLGIVRAIKSVIEARQSEHGSAALSGRRAEPARFVAFEAASEASAANVSVAPSLSEPASPAVAASMAQEGKFATRIQEEFRVMHPLARVWDTFADMSAVAACLPGAEIAEHTETQVKGKITIKFGPMRAAFSGAASLEREPGTKRGAIRGAGIDKLSGSRARGDITYQLFDAGQGSTRVVVMIDYGLQGPLAQFSRGGLVKEFVKTMVNQFASNLEARLGGAGAKPVPSASAQLDVGSVFWNWLWSRIKALFTR